MYNIIVSDLNLRCFKLSASYCRVHYAVYTVVTLSSKPETEHKTTFKVCTEYGVFSVIKL